MSNFDQKMMQRCLELASQARGKTSPNPLVGAVVVKDSTIVGEGFHPQAGQPHAEVFALADAGENAQDATVYVNLEPCNHYGKTPPCTEALIKAGVKQVVVGMVDPDHRVSGRGIKRLAEAGIDVRVGIEEKACQQLNETFCHRIKHQLPLGIFKYAMTLDGKIATKTGHSKWITNSEARDYVHFLRSGCDAVIVGGNTVRKDNPSLTTHGKTDHNPLRVVMTKSLDLPLNCHLWHTKTAKTVIFTLPSVNPAVKSQLEQKKVEIVELTNLNPRLVMENLYNRGFCSVLWECGGNLASQAIASGVVQKIHAFIAPKIIGGNHNFNPIGDLNISNMSEALKLENIKLEMIEKDILVTGYLPS